MNKIDFAIIITARNCNPNGDPLNANRPRQDYDGYGEISDVCIKRKIRDRLQDIGENILVVNREKVTDELYSVKARLDASPEFKAVKSDAEKAKDVACKIWFDVRTFGQVIALKKTADTAATSIRGPVSVGIARSLRPVDIKDIRIIKTTNNDENTYEKDNTTMGVRYIVKHGVYVAYGSIFPQLADLTGFTDEDAEKIKQAIIHLFNNDASQSRPSGSMDCALIWAEHNCKNGVASSAKVHRSFNIRAKDEYPYFEHDITQTPGIKVTVYD